MPIGEGKPIVAKLWLVPTRDACIGVTLTKFDEASPTD